VSPCRFLRTILADRPSRPWASQSSAASRTVAASSFADGRLDVRVRVQAPELRALGV
jgi:hypothetical protein